MKELNNYRQYLLEAALKEEKENDVRMYAAMKHETARLYEFAKNGDEFAQAALETALDWWAIYFAFGEETAQELKEAALQELLKQVQSENEQLRKQLAGESNAN